MINDKTNTDIKKNLTRKKTFRQVYDGTPKDQCDDFRKRIAAATYRSESTVYSWLRGQTTPSVLEATEIAKELNRPIGDLFPEYIWKREQK